MWEDWGMSDEVGGACIENGWRRPNKAYVHQDNDRRS